MALLFIDGVDHLVAADLALKHTLVSGVTVSGPGRTGSLRLDFNTSADFLYNEFTSQATWIIGLAYQQAASSAATGKMFGIRDGATEQCDVRLSSGKIQVTRAGTQLALGTTNINIGVWYYIEFKVTIGNSGSFEVKINGVTEVSGSGVDTQNTANASGNRVYMEIAGSSDCYMDDIYICDGTGSAPYNDFLGDCKVETLYPNGNGNSSQFDGSDGNQTDNYLLVDESPSNGDTDYVESGDVSDKDTYAVGNLAVTTGTVYGVQILAYARKTDAGSRSIKLVARHSATEEDSADKSLSNTYTYPRDLRTTKPGGGTWSISDVNGAEFGQKISV